MCGFIFKHSLHVQPQTMHQIKEDGRQHYMQIKNVSISLTTGD